MTCLEQGSRPTEVVISTRHLSGTSRILPRCRSSPMRKGRGPRRLCPDLDLAVLGGQSPDPTPVAPVIYPRTGGLLLAVVLEEGEE